MPGKTSFKFSHVYCPPREKHFASTHFPLKEKFASLSRAAWLKGLAKDQAYRNVPKYWNLALRLNDSVGWWVFLDDEFSSKENLHPVAVQK